jgi:hypothetical protein
VSTQPSTPIRNHANNPPTGCVRVRVCVQPKAERLAWFLLSQLQYTVLDDQLPRCTTVSYNPHPLAHLRCTPDSLRSRNISDLGLTVRRVRLRSKTTPPHIRRA